MITVLDVIDHWNAWKQESEQFHTLGLRVRELEVRVGGGCGDGLGIILDQIQSKLAIVDYLSVVLDGYREWLYKEHICPIICNGVNHVLEMICTDRVLRLEAEWLDKIETLSWFIRDGTSRPVIEKASGFQRFIIGIAVRVAFHQIGFCRIQYDQLFIDEGFTSCDTDNLERVPDFLRSLLRLYDGICLVTHLEELKECADVHIRIKWDAGLSQIQCGYEPAKKIDYNGINGVNGINGIGGIDGGKNSSGDEVGSLSAVQAALGIATKKRGRPPKVRVTKECAE